ncbi:MAG TPA: LPS export ABC transporter permease LptG [Alphaproteobacteria bacterium]|nr:LPS export ABC transporter permease LptG [Alphaproteobacteria bacterium]
MKIFSLLARYASRSFLISFGVSFLCLLTIIVLFDFAELQRRVGSKEISLSMTLNMVLLRAPHYLEQVLPFLVFVSAIFVFWRMNRANELVIIRSTGVSLWRLILPIGLTALIIGFVDLAVFNPFSSAMHARYDKLEKRYFSKAKEDIKVSSTGLWLPEKMGPNQAIYRADRIDLKKLEFQNLNIIISSPQNVFIERIDAKTAQIKGNRLELKDGWDLIVGQPAQPFAEKIITTSLDQRKIENLRISRGSFSFWKLFSYIDLLEASGLHSLKQKMYWHSMLASAFWVGAMVLLAAAFSCRSLRQGKSVLMILIGLIVGFFLYFFKDMTFALGAAGGLPPFIAAWLPPIVTVMVGAVVVFNQEDG